ncbi:phage holin [Listeria booriae]|uniref:Phage holin n=1 Tax=Listeria booriae TaxID=1552123 RepID=A0A7X1CC55_9LIST|nr:phage holin [Listeria booriae]MBC1491960.1 phage holin [Listeria booriae]MBC1524102.1 phage holin [Listeria booriae]MBC2389086.1 phage holin [Listeria booriae]
MKKINLKGVTTATWVRTGVLAVALVNQGLTIAGKNPLPFSDGQTEQAVTFIVTALSAVLAGWKNQSFTKAAQNADEQLKLEKGKGVGK